MTKKAFIDYLPRPKYDIKLLAMAVPSGVVLGVIPGMANTRPISDKGTGKP